MLRSATRGVKLTSAFSRAAAASRPPAFFIQQKGLRLSAVKNDPEKPQSKLDELLPRVEDFPSHHIGPRKIEAKVMLHELGYNVRKN